MPKTEHFDISDIPERDMQGPEDGGGDQPTRAGPHLERVAPMACVVLLVLVLIASFNDFSCGIKETAVTVVNSVDRGTEVVETKESAEMAVLTAALTGMAYAIGKEGTASCAGDLHITDAEAC